MLTLNREYFRLRSPLDRRIYEIARKHCGKQERKHFVAHLRAMVQANELPDYAMTLEEDQVVFWRREGQGAKPPKPARAAPPPGLDAPPAPAERRIALSEWAIERLCELAPRWDKQRLQETYINWAKSVGPADNENARFIAWVKRYTKRKEAP